MGTQRAVFVISIGVLLAGNGCSAHPLLEAKLVTANGLVVTRTLTTYS